MVKLHLLNKQHGQYYRQTRRRLWPTKVASIKSCLVLMFIDACTELLNNVCNVIFKQTPHFISRMRSYKFTKKLIRDLHLTGFQLPRAQFKCQTQIHGLLYVLKSWFCSINMVSN